MIIGKILIKSQIMSKTPLSSSFSHYLFAKVVFNPLVGNNYFVKKVIIKGGSFYRSILHV